MKEQEFSKCDIPIKLMQNTGIENLDELKTPMMDRDDWRLYTEMFVSLLGQNNKKIII